MAESWFYLQDGNPVGPVGQDAVAALLRSGSLGPASYVWKEGTADWLPVAEVPELRPLMVPVSVLPPPLPGQAGQAPFRSAAQRRDGLLGNLAAGISHYTELPTLSGVPIREILLGGLHAGSQPISIEDELPVVVRRWFIAVILHGLWDTNFYVIPWFIQEPLLLILGWYIIFAIMKEALAQVAAAQQVVLTTVVLAQRSSQG